MIKDVVSNTSLTSYQSAKVINTIFGEITNELVKGNIVSIEEFGRFKKYRVEDHAGVNPGTGESIVIEAHNRINFAPSKQLKDSFKGQKPNFKKKEYVKNKVIIEKAVEENDVIVKPAVKKAKKPAVISRRKTDIIKAIMTSTGLSKGKSSLFLNTMLDQVTTDMIDGNTVSLDGVGTFKKYRVEDHAGVNPGTGESIVIEAHNRVKYVPSKDLKSKLNQ